MKLYSIACETSENKEGDLKDFEKIIEYGTKPEGSLRNLKTDISKSKL
jgi:hypothetical protein